MKERVMKLLNSLAALAVFTWGFASVAHGATENAGEETETSRLSLTCYIDDLQATIHPETEWTRENLLVAAVYEAASRYKTISFEDVRYNLNIPKAPVSVLEIRVHQWRRSHSGFYDFRGSATYYDNTGEKHPLGIISGTESSITVFNGFDVRDAFENVVKQAVNQALRKIDKLDETSPEA